MRYLCLSLIFCSGAVASAADWSRFRGPNGGGLAPESNPPQSWSDEENVRWKLELPGPGSSCPVVAGDRVFVTSYEVVETGEESAMVRRYLVCVDAPSGDLVWSKEIAPVVKDDPFSGFLETEHGYASNTPVVAGDRVFAFYGKAGVAAYSLDGEELWTFDAGKETSEYAWGSAASPVVWNDFVLVPASEESETLYALHQETGERAWSYSGMSVVYSTPNVITRDGRDELVVTMNDRLVGLAPDTGVEKWSFSTDEKDVICASPVVGDGVVYAFGGRGTPSVAFSISGDGETEEVWSSRENAGIPTPVLYSGRLYWGDASGIATCIDATTGEEVFKERLPDLVAAGGRVPIAVYASPIVAGGKVYVTTRQSGVYVLDAGTPDFQLLSHNRLESDESQFNATPAIAGDALFLRSDQFLYCFAEE